jgi:phenylacetate-coenzyme A ligase PaaK-like adenylate-forming protein
LGWTKAGEIRSDLEANDGASNGRCRCGKAMPIVSGKTEIREGAHDATDGTFWDENLETQRRTDWDGLKLLLLKKHLQHAYAGSPYYRVAFDAAGVHPDQVEHLADLRRFPFITKQTLRERQIAAPPFGDLVAVPERDIVYISASSGSTGVPTASPFTAQDFDEWMDYEARQFWSSGMRPTDRYCHSLNFSLFIGGPCVHLDYAVLCLVPWRDCEQGGSGYPKGLGSQAHLRGR